MRVPALIVSPWIEPGSVSTTVFDHTSIIKTILLRFAPDALNQPKRHRGLLAKAATAGHPRYLEHAWRRLMISENCSHAAHHGQPRTGSC